MQSRIFQEISSNDFTGNNLMTDMFGGNDQYNRQNDQNGIQMKFGELKIW